MSVIRETAPHAVDSVTSFAARNRMAASPTATHLVLLHFDRVRIVGVFPVGAPQADVLAVAMTHALAPSIPGHARGETGSFFDLWTKSWHETVAFLDEEQVENLAYDHTVVLDHPARGRLDAGQGWTLLPKENGAGACRPPGEARPRARAEPHSAKDRDVFGKADPGPGFRGC